MTLLCPAQKGGGGRRYRLAGDATAGRRRHIRRRDAVATGRRRRCLRFDFVEYADVIDDKLVLSDDVVGRLAGVVVFAAVAFDFRRDENEFGRMGDVLRNVAVFDAVDVERVARLVPKHSETMEDSLVEAFDAAGGGARHVESVAAREGVVADDFACFEAFHDVDFRAGHGGIQTGSDDRRLHPEGAPPAFGALLEAAAAFVIAVQMGEEILLQLADGPLEVVAAECRLLDGFVHEIVSGLKLRADGMAVLHDDIENDVAVAVEMDGLVGPRVMSFAHHGHAKVPFGAVEFGAVEFVVPDEIPIAVREEAVFMICESEFLHGFSP